VKDRRVETTTLRPSTADAAGEPDQAAAWTGEVDPIARERARLAYAIHDGLTQVVTASVLELEWLARRATASPEEAAAALRAGAEELRRALEEIRGVLARLSPESPSGTSALEDLVRDLRERWQLPAEWTVEGDLGAAPQELLEVASAVIREAVANAAKHSGAGRVRVRVSAAPDLLEARVEDDGCGFAPEDVPVHDGHLGLAMMRRRVEEVGGELRVESSPADGTRVVARLPRGKEPNREDPHRR
jgi:signal transduction histidine kinase